MEIKMIKEKFQEAIDLLNHYHYKNGYFFDKENNKISVNRIEVGSFSIEFRYRALKNIDIEIKVFDNVGIYIDRYYDTKQRENYYCFSDNFEIKFNSDGNITDIMNCKIKNLPKNIFDWTEEDFFYMKLKNG